MDYFFYTLAINIQRELGVLNMSYTQKILTKRFTIDATAAGIEEANILGSGAKRLSGYLRQIVVRQSSGTATVVDLEIRYESGNSDLENLVYTQTAGALDFTDSGIDAPFSLLEPGISGGGNYSSTLLDRLQLFIQPDAAGTFEVKIDFEIY